MRKNLLGLSIAAMIGGLGLAGTASAGVSFAGSGGVGNATLTSADALKTSVDGMGHILLAPYFSTQSGNSTLISIVNTDTTNGKAVKVRFRGAANSDDIFDFQVYMSPGDVWTANVSQGADGLSRLTTNDASCTIPSRSVLNSTPFVVGRLPAVSATFTAAEQASWTREGYVEVLNMADIPPITAASAALQAATLFTQIKHVSGVAPGCPAGETTGSALLALNVDPASEAAAVTLGFNTPTTGLMGSTTIINVAGAAAAWSANMDAIVAVNTATGDLNANGDRAAGRGKIVFSPQTAIAAATPALFTADPLLTVGATPAVAAANYDLPDLSTPYVAGAAGATPTAQAEALTKSLAVYGIQNEYLTTNAVITAATDWTFTMPTRRYAVAFDYVTATAANQAVFNPLATYFNTTNVTKSGRLLCVNPGGAVATSWGQEEQSSSVTTGFVISPSTLAPAFSFCGEAAVLAFSTNAANTVLNATIAKSTPGTAPIGTAGWQAIPTPGIGNKGLPILGSSYVKVTGPVVNGASTNFSMTNGHRTIRPLATP